MADPAAGRPDGFYNAGEHLYELQGQMLRAVRVRVDTGIHTGRMSHPGGLFPGGVPREERSSVKLRAPANVTAGER